MHRERKRLKGRTRTLGLIGLVSCCVRASLGQATAPAADANLADRLATLRGIERLEVKFVCQRRILNLEVSLVSSGTMWMTGGDAGGLRVATDWPYRSELILIDGKAKARSQHETAWSLTAQSSRPGLTAVLRQIGRWSTGAPGQADLFAVARGSGEIPARPAAKGMPAAPAASGETFVLTPAGKELAVSVKSVTLGFAKAPATVQPGFQMIYAEMITAQGDATRYWFCDPVINGPLPEGVFEPENSAPPASQTGAIAPAGGGSDIIPRQGE